MTPEELHDAFCDDRGRFFKSRDKCALMVAIRKLAAEQRHKTLDSVLDMVRCHETRETKDAVKDAVERVRRS